MDEAKPSRLPLPASRFKFGLWQLFYAAALIAVGLALSPSTIWVSLLVLVCWGGGLSFICLAPRSRRAGFCSSWANSVPLVVTGAIDLVYKRIS